MITETDQQGKSFLQKEEGCRLKAYQDRAGVWTIAYGNTYYLDGTSVKEGDKITQLQADQLFDKLVPEYYTHILPLNLENQGQFNALVSLVWNIGEHAFLESSLRALIVKNPDDQTLITLDDIIEPDIHRELMKYGHQQIHLITYNFLKWNKSGGSFDIGLYDRRWREASLYLNQNPHGDNKFA